MKAIKQFLFTLLGAIVLVVGAEVAMVAAVGKEALRQLPLVGDLFVVEEKSDVVKELEDPRCAEVEKMVAELKAMKEQQADLAVQMEQIRRMRADLEAIEQRNRQLFTRIGHLYLIIDEAQRETLKVLARKYEKVPPEIAAQILEGKTDRECAELLLIMNDRSSAKILAAYTEMGESVVERERNRKRATKISQLMRSMLLLTNEQAKLFAAP